jgi:V/A-type H+-transporting ATPase subunit C
MNYQLFVLVLLLLLGLLFPYLVFLARSVKNIVPYLYLNARISAKQGRLIKKNMLNDMIDADSIAELASRLENTDYAFAMPDLVLDNAESIERLLMRYTAAVYRELADMMPKKISSAFSFLLQEWDVKNIKTILRGIRRGLPPGEILSRIIPVGEMPSPLLSKLAEAGTVEQSIAHLEGTQYAFVTELIQRYEQDRTLLVIESALDKWLLETMWNRAMADPELMVLRPFLAARLDGINLKILFRAKRDLVPLSEIMPHLILGGEILDGPLKIFDEVDEIGALIASIEWSPFYHPLTDAFPEYEKTGSLAILEKVVDETVLKVGRDTAIKFPYGIAPVAGYLALRETELRNIRAIARLKEVGMPPDQIRELILVV